MIKKRSVFFIFILLFSSALVFDNAYAHSMFNSAEKYESGYRVQVATAPEFPQIGEPSQFRVKVTEGFEYKDVDYAGKDIEKGLEKLAEDISVIEDADDLSKGLDKLREAFNLVNSWYADKTTKIKPKNILQLLFVRAMSMCPIK